MKLKLKDENGFPINFDPSRFYGFIEWFKEIPSTMFNTAPGKYYVTSWGRIYNTENHKYVPRELMPSTNRYVVTMIKDIYNNEVNVIMHLLVAAMFIGPKPVCGDTVFVINHKDGIKWHNEPYNLEWCTLSENTIHADQNNLIERPYGEDNGASVLTDEQYREICRLTQEGYKAHEINDIMNLGFNITNIAQKIRNGKSEAIISQEYDFSNIPRNDYRKFSEDQVRYICECLQNKPEMSFTEILISMGYDPNVLDKAYMKKLRDTISTIKRRKSYIEIGNDYIF